MAAKNDGQFYVPERMKEMKDEDGGDMAVKVLNVYIL